MIIWLCGSLLMLAVATGFVCALSPLDDSDALMDPDKDGLTNVEEFNAGADPNNPDTDNDGLPDGWEWDYMLDPTDPTDALHDEDYSDSKWENRHEEYALFTQVPGPHYTNYDEYYRYSHTDTDGNDQYLHTSPQCDNTDGDELLDPDDPTPLGGSPVPPTPPDPDPTKPYPGPGPFDPDEQDPDGDGIKTKDEYKMGTDPFNADTDGDGLRDGQELKLGLDPNDWDIDNDGLMDGSELGLGTQSTDGHFVDSDNDGIDGPTEDDTTVDYPWGEKKPQNDPDGDGIVTDDEYKIGTDPNNADTDGDGLRDGQEVKLGLDPNDWDTDNDRLMDSSEIGFSEGSTDGHQEDTDSDGLGGCGGCAPGAGAGTAICPIIPQPGMQM